MVRLWCQLVLLFMIIRLFLECTWRDCLHFLILIFVIIFARWTLSLLFEAFVVLLRNWSLVDIVFFIILDEIFRTWLVLHFLPRRKVYPLPLNFLSIATSNFEIQNFWLRRRSWPRIAGFARTLRCLRSSFIIVRMREFCKKSIVWLLFLSIRALLDRRLLVAAHGQSMICGW